MNQIKLADEQVLKKWFAHPLVAMSATHQLGRIDLLSRQIAELEQPILDLTRDNVGYKRLR
jgi:hypothetical protein